MAEGITTEIISALSGVPGVHMAPHLASIRFKDSAQDLHAAATALNVRYIVTGSLRRSEARTRVIAELSDVAEDNLIWWHTYDPVGGRRIRGAGRYRALGGGRYRRAAFTRALGTGQQGAGGKPACVGTGAQGVPLLELCVPH